MYISIQFTSARIIVIAKVHVYSTNSSKVGLVGFLAKT